MGRRNRHDNLFNESLMFNMRSYQQYVDRLTDLALSMFEWEGLPESVDQRYLEMTLFSNGVAVFFKDEVVGYLALSCTPAAMFDVYGYPTERRAYSQYNNYQKNLGTEDSVVIYNNYLHKPCIVDIELYARRLSLLDRIIDVNVNAQRTPTLLQGTEKQRLTLINLYQKWDGNQPFIFGDKNLDLNMLKVLNTDAPFVSDKLYMLKSEIWNEALTYLGISNVNTFKKEKVIIDEVAREQGGTVASRYSRLDSRQSACDKINRMFGLSVSVEYRADYIPADSAYSDDGGQYGRDGGDA